MRIENTIFMTFSACDVFKPPEGFYSRTSARLSWTNTLIIINTFICLSVDVNYPKTKSISIINKLADAVNLLSFQTI